jgi:hypothetical protein
MAGRPVDINRVFMAIRRDDVDAVTTVIEAGTPMDSLTYPGSFLFHALLWKSYVVAAYLLSRGAALRPAEYGMFTAADRKAFRAHISEHGIAAPVKALLQEVVLWPAHQAAMRRRLPLLTAYSRAEEGKTRRLRKARRKRFTRRRQGINKK